MMEIEWKLAPSTLRYEASSDGQIRMVGRATARKPFPSRTGYRQVGMCINGKIYCKTVHSLVAEAFLGPRPKGLQTRHIDGRKENNRADNLSYGTAIENAADRDRHGRTKRGVTNGNAKIKAAAIVDEIRRMYATGTIEQRPLARMFGISQAQINNIVLNKQHKKKAAGITQTERANDEFVHNQKARTGSEDANDNDQREPLANHHSG